MVVPGVFDVLSAKVADAVGFPSAMLTGYGVSAAHLGEPDFGILTQTQVLDVARRVVAVTEFEAFNRFIGADERYAEDERFKR